MRGRVVDGTGHAAVLVVLYDDLFEGGAEPHVLLTRRSSGMRHHGHEVSFPGGRIDDGDKDPYRAALREAQEEVALDPDSVRLVGTLDRYATVGARMLIHPFVVVCGTVPEVHVASPREVETILTVALCELMLPEVWREELWRLPAVDGGAAKSRLAADVPGPTVVDVSERAMTKVPDPTVAKVPGPVVADVSGRAVADVSGPAVAEVSERAMTFFELTGDTIWGATAAMLRDLLVLVTGVDDTSAR